MNENFMNINNPLTSQQFYGLNSSQNNQAVNGMQFGTWNNSYNNFPSARNQIAAPPPSRNISQNGGIVWVNGLEGAKGYIVQPNSSVILMDSERNYFYWKTANESGIPNMRIFEFQEHQIQTEKKQDENNNIDEKLKQYVPRTEFEDLKQILESISNSVNIILNNNPPSMEMINKEFNNNNNNNNNKYIFNDSQTYEQKKEG